MSKVTHFFIIVSILLPFLSILSPYNSNFIILGCDDSISKINILNSQDFNFTGSYNGEIAIVYLHDETISGSFGFNDTVTKRIAANTTQNGYFYNLQRIDVNVFDMTNGTDNYSIAENKDLQSNVSNGVIAAQEFTAPELIAITDVWIYLNYSLNWTPVDDYRLQLFIMGNDWGDILAVSEQWKSDQSFSGWLHYTFSSNNILNENQNYSLAFVFKRTLESDPEVNDFWKAQNYTSPNDNKGISKRYNGTEWIPIQDDNYRDFTPGNYGYKAVYLYPLEEIPINEVEVETKTNTTVTGVDVTITAYYMYRINGSGFFNTSSGNINWIMNYSYQYIQSWDLNDLFFLFESDWSFDGFYDPDGLELSVFFGPMTIYNTSFYGLFPMWGIQLQIDNYTGKFHSPNYCNQIKTKIWNETEYLEVLSFELGQTIRLEALIKNSDNELISGGTGYIELISPSGTTIYNQTGLTAINGIMNTSDLLLENNLTPGIYIVKMFWTNGREVAYYSTNIEVKAHPTSLQIPPLMLQSEGLSVEFLIILGIIVGAAILATPLALIARNRIRQRNWEKALRNLFVITKDGISVYGYSFGYKVQDPDLISGMILAITNFVKEATGSKKLLRTIDQEDKKVILSHGEYSTSALLADKDLPIIHKQLEKFTKDFENTYSKHLKKWSGDVRVFRGADKIVERHFPIDLEEKMVRGVKQKLEEFLERIKTISDSAEVISLMKEITEFISKYQEIVTIYFLKDFDNLIKNAEEKLNK
ncbi:MAG: hypothetical protein ACTSR3_14000 [Candidatus Helarchaeota archaeon]